MRGGRIAAIVMAAALLVVPMPARATTTPVIVFAHRGGAGLAPENTLGAFRQAAARFGDRGVWLELDTQLTADGHLVVMHDDTVDRTTTCSGDVNAFTLAALAPCDASESFPGWPSFEPVPTLRDVLVEGRSAGWRLMIEIKNIPLENSFDALGTEVADALLALVAETRFPAEHLIVQSFWPLSLDRIERGFPAVRIDRAIALGVDGIISDRPDLVYASSAP